VKSAAQETSGTGGLEGPYVCGVCGWSAPALSRLTRHMRETHGAPRMDLLLEVESSFTSHWVGHPSME
jgi:hypothetical protein